MKNTAFMFVCALICTVVSERMFWFWNTSFIAHLEVSAYYVLPVAFTMWALGRYQVNGWWSLCLAVPFFAYVTEGVITPVLYSGGPFVPFFPVWFSAWHGMMAFGFALVAIRRWLLLRAWRPLTISGIAFGVFWGVWASTLRLPENLNDPDLIGDHGELVVLDPQAFTGYAALFGAVFIAAHWLLGLVWPASYSPSRWTQRIVGGLVFLGAGMWTFTLPWALPMFVAYVGLQRWGLRRHRDTARRPDIFAQLHGRISPAALVPLVTIIPTAALSYWGLWVIDPSVLALLVIFYSAIAVQTASGGWLMFRSFRRVRSGFADVALVDHRVAQPAPVG